MKRTWMAAVIGGLLVSGCSRPSSEGVFIPEPSSRAPVAASPSPTTLPSPAGPSFEAMIARIGPETRDRMPYSWHEGCPVPVEDLRLLTMSFWGYDGHVHTGELMLNADVSRQVVRVFRRLFEARFPIRRMRLVDEYHAVDDRSMAANNTSGFNCRWRAGSPGVWSEHAFGRAIDLNPLVNPYVTSSGFVDPASGRPYVDRTRDDLGMIHDGDVVVRAFASIGWEWGGNWTSIKDYQHFSETGR